jgi:hypothetical protein
MLQTLHVRADWRECGRSNFLNFLNFRGIRNGRKFADDDA